MFWKSWQRKTKADTFLEDADDKRLHLPALRGHLLLWAIAGLLVIFFLWASMAEIDEVTTGTGKVIPSSKIQVIQHHEGGIVEKILVREGEEVKRGQVLMEIDNVQFDSQYREGSIKAASLQAKIVRLSAEAYGTPFIIPDAIKTNFPGLAQNEQRLYEANTNKLNATLKTHQAQLDQKQQELAQAEAKIKKLTRSLELVSEEYRMTKLLYEEGAASKVEAIRLERQVNDLSGELKESQLQARQAQNGLEEAQSKLNEVNTDLRSAAANELSKVKSEYSTQAEANRSLEDRALRTDIKSPVNGLIKVINVNTVGGSIRPGMDLMEIVPSEDTLLIEAKVRPADVAFIHPGQKAMIKLTAYDFLVYGGLIGHVEHISADTIVDTEGEKNQSYYQIKIRTEKNHLSRHNKNLPIIPGMTAEVDILTGKKTVLDYILKPLLKSRNKALRER